MAIKKITELTLAELQNELGKRGLDKSGDKSVLLARLRKVSESHARTVNRP